jgi:single-strand DNA-binding protein
LNKIHLVGRLTKDPELTFTQGNGTAIAKFTLAVNRTKLDKTKQQEADFINCVCFGKRAEAIANYVLKGHLFGVSGRLQISKYVDKDKNNRWSTDVIVEDFEFFPNKNDNASSNQNNSNSKNNNQHEDLTPIDDGEIPF